MEAVYFGNSTDWGRGAGNGPWVMADLENGLWAGSEKVNPNNAPVTFDFVTAMVKGGSNGFALKSGDATQGALTSQYDGPRPNGYQPMVSVTARGCAFAQRSHPPPAAQPRRRSKAQSSWALAATTLTLR
jgi:hypothetical protein